MSFFNPLACLLSAKKVYAEWRIRSYIVVDDYFKGHSSTPSATANKFIRWYPPQSGVVKINFDKSCNHFWQKVDLSYETG